MADVGRPQQRWQQQQQQRALSVLTASRRSSSNNIVNKSPSALSSSRVALGTFAIFNCVVVVVDGRRRSSQNCRESAVIEAVSTMSVQCRQLPVAAVVALLLLVTSCMTQPGTTLVTHNMHYDAEILILFR